MIKKYDVCIKNSDLSLSNDALTALIASLQKIREGSTCDTKVRLVMSHDNQPMIAITVYREKYHCDRCKKAMNGPSHYRLLKEAGSVQYSTEFHYDLCDECKHKLSEVLSNFIWREGDNI